MNKRALTRRVIGALIGAGLLAAGVVLPPLVPTPITLAAGPTGTVRLAVVSATTSAPVLPFRDFAVTTGQPIAQFHWIVNEDNIGDPTYDEANCLPASARDANTPAAGTGDFPASCTWPSIRAIDGHSPVVATGDQSNWPSAGLTLPNGKYLVSVTADGFKIDGAHFTVNGETPQAPVAVQVQMNALPLPSATVRVNIFNDNASTNGQFDGEPESTTDMSGFIVHLNDVAGEVEFDVYGNPLCTEYETAGQGRMVFDGDGAPIPMTLDHGGTTGGHLPGSWTGCITGPDGQVAIPNLGPNRYAVTVSPPDPQNAAAAAAPWIQTTTLEGGKDWDTWNMEGSTGFDTELVVGGEATPFVNFGFVKQQNQLTTTRPGRISGRLMVGRTYVAQTGGLPNPGTIWGGGTGTVLERPIEDGWLSLACLAGCPSLQADQAVYVQPANADGTFTISNVPNGTYMLTMWNEAIDRLLDTVQVTVTGGQIDLGAFPLAGWFTDLEGSVFLDANGNGRREPNEAGVPDFGLSLRTRVNTLQDQGAATAATGPDGDWSMGAYPLGQFLILEAYHPAYRTTGITWKLNNESTSHTQLTDQVDWNVLNIFGLGGKIDIGVQPYAPGTNGGIVGTVSYDVTRNELNPRNAATEDWQPGVPDMTMQLWRPAKNPDGSFRTVGTGPNKGAIVQLCGASGNTERPLAQYGRIDAPGGCDPIQAPQTTEHWSRPEGCIARTADGTPAFTEAFVNDGAGPCIEAPMTSVQVGTNGEVDGNYGFGDLGSGDYLVEAIPPTDASIASLNGRPAKPVYKFTDETAINVFQGDSYVSQDGVAYDGSAASGSTAVARSNYRENTSDSACAGALHLVHVTDQTFIDNGGNPAEGLQRPYCNVKLVRVQPRRSIAPIFHVYTDVPIPTRFVGYIIDDLNVSTNPKSTVFGEKAGMSNVPVGIYDYTGRLVYTAESDYNGYYEALLPSTDTIACPTPSGVCPNVYRLVGNDPGQLTSPNANFNPQYRTIGTEFQGWPGVVHPVDQAPTRVAASFQLPGSQTSTPPACTVAATTPQFFAIDKPYGAAGSGPYTISGSGFGATAGTLVLGTSSLRPENVTSWTDTRIVFSLPTNAPAGAQAMRIITSARAEATNVITFHVIGAGYQPTVLEVGVGKTYDPTADDPQGTGTRAIQRALDAAHDIASPLVVVYPNTAAQFAPFNPDRAYFENIVVHSKVKLQGVGPGGPAVPGSRIDGRYFWTGNANGDGIYAQNWLAKVDALPVAGNPTVAVGQVVLVRPETNSQFNGTFTAAIDGFTITGGDQQGFPTNLNFLGGGPNGTPRPGVNNVETQGGGVFVNAYAQNTVVSNNVFTANGGTFGGAIRVGNPDLGNGAGPGGTENVQLADNHNRNIKVLHNRILANGGTNLAGAVAIFYGTDGYDVGYNDICGNASAEYGGGITHYGRSPGGRIHHNRIIFNQAYDEAGGIMIAGELPSNTSVLSSGSGAVSIDHNDIESNLSNDDGGGIRFLMAAGRQNDTMTVVDNIVANNVATHEGGGIAIDNTPDVRIINNTIVKNITTATAMTSTGAPAPAGVSTGANSAVLQTRLNRLYGNANSPKFSNPVLLNNVFADNRAGTWTASGVAGVGLPGDASPPLRWDVGTGDGSGTPTVFGSVVDSSPSNTAYRTGKGFVLGTGSTDLQMNGNSGMTKVGFVQTFDTQVSVANWRTFPNFQPAAIVNVDQPMTQVANYHLNATRPATATPIDVVVDRGLTTLAANLVRPYPTQLPPTTDIDDSARPTGAGIDLGADEIAPLPALPTALPVPPPPPPAPVPLLDNFNRNNASGLGGNWTFRSVLSLPVLQVNINQARPGQLLNTNGFAMWNSPLTAADQAVGVTVAQVPGNQQNFGLVMKANGTTNFGVSSGPSRFIEVRFTRTGNNQALTSATGTVAIGIGTTAAGGVTNTFGPTTNLTINNGDRLVATASSTGVVRFYVNDVLVTSAQLVAPGWPSTSNATGGQVGLRYVTTNNTNISSNLRLDDFLGGNQ